MELLKVQNVSKAYSSHKALEDVSLEVKRQSIFGLLGPNGAGKTTLIRIITQIINQDKGEIFLDGSPITPADVRKIGYLPEERGLYKKMKVGEQLMFLGGLKGLNKAESKKQIKFWFDKLNIEGWFDKKMEDLSKGMSQKVQFIATVMHDPKLIILDEPFSGFDPVNANLIRDNIMELRDRGATIIFSTHRMETVEELCDHVAMINRSRKILDGTKQEIKQSYKTHTFEVHHEQPFNLSGTEFSVASSTPIADGMLSSLVRTNGQGSANDLLRKLIDLSPIHYFSEKIPTMNEIFITKVQEGGSHE